MVEVIDKATQEAKDSEQDTRLTKLENESIENKVFSSSTIASHSWKIGDRIVGGWFKLTGTSQVTSASFTAYVSAMNFVCISVSSSKISFKGNGIIKGNIVDSESTLYYLTGIDYDRSTGNWYVYLSTGGMNMSYQLSALNDYSSTNAYILYMV